jgi:hypothetical protein
MAAVAIWGRLAGEDAAGYHDAIVGLNPQHYLADALARIADHPEVLRRTHDGGSGCPPKDS